MTTQHIDGPSMDETLAMWDKVEDIELLVGVQPSWLDWGFEPLFRIRELVRTGAGTANMLKLVSVLGMKNESQDRRLQDPMLFAIFTLKVQLSYAFWQLLRSRGIDPATI